MRISYRTFLVPLIFLVGLFACSASRTGSLMGEDDMPVVDPVPKRLSSQSPWFYVAEEDIDVQVTYSGFDPNNGESFTQLGIEPKAIEMIKGANKVIIASVFLFDMAYSDHETKWDVVRKFTNLLIQKKVDNPSMTIAIILDPVNRAYGKHISPAMHAMLYAGIDIFISDLLATKSSSVLGLREGLNHIGRFTNRKLAFGIFGKVGDLITERNVPIQTPLGKGVSIKKLWNASALKANHRKVMVVDSGPTYESIVTSANPHNASVPNSNYGTTVRGDLAKYIYMVLREDVKHSIGINHAVWHYEEIKNLQKEYKRDYLRKYLPPFDLKDIQPGQASITTPVRVSFMTENRIQDQIITMLSEVYPGDEIRIQMFFLSNMPVIRAIMDASKKVNRPIRIILDPNKDSFNMEKNGTPNRQVASYLVGQIIDQGLNLKIRWYDTHGYQNHAKIMSITNSETGKYELINGSANWTRKNLGNINMEANLRIMGSMKVTEKFNQSFDLLWTNDNNSGMIYTMGYHEKSSAGGKGYDTHAGMMKWRLGEKLGYVGW